jgi:lipoprotein-anchoring transpeptidase ErfK/SrfK
MVCAALLVATVLMLAVAPPSVNAPTLELAQVLYTPTPSPRPTRTATATPSPTALPSSAVTPRGATQRPPTPVTTPTVTTEPTATPFPFDTHPERDRFVYVDQATQHMWVFERGLLVRDIPCSTGLPGDTTYTEAWTGEIGDYWGTFYAFDVYADDAWYLYPSLGSILVHSLPYVLRNGYKVYLERDALGVRPASHGCIRIAPEDAAWFTAWNPKGVLMVITDPYRELWQQRLGP